MKRNLLFLFSIVFFCVTAQGQDNISARRPFGQHTVAFSATPTFDAGTTENWKMTLTGNVASSTLIGAEAGMFLKWEICQDGVGSHTFAWPSQLQNPITIVATANACTTEIFYYDGTNGLIPVTTTSGGGGSGTVNGGTVNRLALYTGATTVSSDGSLDDGLTTANTLTYTGTGGIASTNGFTSSGTGPIVFTGTEGLCSGATVGKIVPCFGDSVAKVGMISNDGDSFRPFATHQSTSPTPHGVVLAETFPQIFAASRGTQGQAFIEGSPTGDPGFGQLDLSLSTNVINRLVKANQTASTVYNDQANTGTAAFTLDASGATSAAAFIVPRVAGATSTTSGNFKYDTTSNNWHLGTNSADSIAAIFTGATPTTGNCVKWNVVSGHVEIADALTTCGGGSTPRLDQVLSATNAWTTTNGDNPLSLQFAPTTSGRVSVDITESSAGTSGGTPFLFRVHTLAASTMNPCQFTARGTANGVQCDAVTGTLSPIGTAHLNADEISGVPIPSTGSSTAGRIPITDGSGNAAWGDPLVTYNSVNLFNAVSATGTQTSSNVTNSVFSQTGTLSVTWASITGSPSGCAIQIKGVDSLSNSVNDGSAISVSPANGTTTQQFTAAAGVLTASKIAAVYACSVYPTTGTLSLDFSPQLSVNVPNTVTATETNLPATVDTNSGNKSASTIRVVLATDQPQLTNKLLVTPDANSAVNVAQVGGSTVVANPCDQLAASSANINLTASGRIIVGVSAKQTYICSMDIITATAQNIALVEGTGTTCGTSTAGMAGGATAATGWNFAANGGLVKGAGIRWVFKTATAADDVCLLLSSTGQTSGSVQYVQQ